MEPIDALKLRLFDAVQSGDREAIERMLDEHAGLLEASLYRNERHPPLHLARKPPMAELLLARGADVATADARGQTALHLAASRGDLDVARFLLERGADPAARDRAGDTPLHVAAGDGRLKLVKLLLPVTPDAGGRNHEGKTPLDLAAEYARAPVAEFLAARGLAPGVHDLAARAEHGALREALARDPAGAHITRHGSVTPLHLAADAETASILVESGVPLDILASDHRTPLHFAAEAGRADTVRFLLAKGAHADARTIHGETALHLAARRGHTEVVLALVEHGADPDLRCRGRTPWMEAEAAHHAETARVLAGFAAPLDVFQAALTASLELVRRLVEDEPALVHKRSAIGSTALHAAAHSGAEALVGFLLERGAEIDAVDAQGMTPLVAAVQEGHEGVARMLLDRGADVDGGRPGGPARFTPMHAAAIAGHLGLMRLLLERGADLERLDESGQSALDWAEEAEAANWREAVRFLKDAMRRRAKPARPARGKPKPDAGSGSGRG